MKKNRILVVIIIAAFLFVVYEWRKTTLDAAMLRGLESPGSLIQRHYLSPF